MDKLSSLALIGFLGATFLACSDDAAELATVPDPDAGNGAMTGTGGAGGTGSMAGTGGSAAGTGGTGTVPVFTGIATCSQCAEVEVPVSGGNSAANVLDQVGFPFYYAAPGQDFSNVTVTWHVMALENHPDLMVAPYIENGAPYPGVYGAHIALSEENFPPGEWVEVVFDLSRVPLPPTLPDGGLDAGVVATDAGGAGLVPEAGVDGGIDASVQPGSPFDGGKPGASKFGLIEPAFDKRLVEQLGLYVGSATTLVGDAVARVAIDGVTFTGTPERADILFETGLQGFTRNNYNEPPGSQGPLYHP